jgi:hypothetical protein
MYPAPSPYFMLLFDSVEHYFSLRREMLFGIAVSPTLVSLFPFLLLSAILTEKYVSLPAIHPLAPSRSPSPFAFH